MLSDHCVEGKRSSARCRPTQVQSSKTTLRYEGVLLVAWEDLRSHLSVPSQGLPKPSALISPISWQSRKRKRDLMSLTASAGPGNPDKDQAEFTLALLRFRAYYFSTKKNATPHA